MGRIFVSAGHGGIEDGRRDPGTIAGGTTEAQQMILLRDLLVPELRSRGFEVYAVPDTVSLRDTLSWINTRARPGDVAIELHADAYSNPSARGATAYYIAGNNQRKQQGDMLLLALIRRLPQLPSRGSKPDTATGVGRLSFCRDIAIPSLLLEVGFLTNPEDRNLIINRRRDMAVGIADGLESWSRDVSGTAPAEPTYPAIAIRINTQNYDEQGILINNNSFIPIDLVDVLGVEVEKLTNLRLVEYRGVVYIKAIELRDHGISVGWDNDARAVVLKSITQICPGTMDHIMSNGHTSEVQLMMFLKANNENALEQFPDLPKLYREEASIEGVNYDIAFAQMCLSTNFLRFGGEVKASQNNFSNLGAVGGGAKTATFPSAQIGVRAHIQHLKAYASAEPLVQELVDPRFRFVKRGVAPLVNQLSGRWSSDPQYGEKILAILRRLYESAGLM